MNKISIVIPAYNTADTLPQVLNELQTYLRKVWDDYDVEIIIINDGSTDNTLQVLNNIAKQSNIQVLHHHRNKGYGAALKTGIRHASGEIIVTFDADGQHNPADIPKLVKAVEEGANMAVGARQKFIHSPLWRMPGKWFLGWLANFLSGTRIPDLNCGLRAFKKSVVSKYLHLCPDGFSFSMTLTLALINRGYAVEFVPIFIRKRQGIRRSSVTVATGFTTLLLMLRLMTLFNPLRVFLPASFFCIGIGIAWGMRYLLLGRGLSTAALLFLLTGVIIFFFGLLADQIAELRKEKYE